MTHKEFFTKVAEMRTLQRNYFGTRSPYTLIKCRKAEKEIDDEIRRVQEITAWQGAKSVGSLFE